MSDWAVGDLAVCVDDGPHPWHPHSLVAGRIYRVTVVLPPAPCAKYGGRLDIGLLVSGVPCASPSGFAHERFRKIRPDEQAGEMHDWELLLDQLSKPRVSA